MFGYTHLRIEIKAFDGREGYAEYSFLVDDESLLYKIHVTWISGDIGGEGFYQLFHDFIWTNIEILYPCFYVQYCTFLNIILKNVCLMVSYVQPAFVQL